MAICSKCGREISETALYCSKCGTKNLTRISFRTAAPRKQKKSRKGVKVIAVLLIIAFVITAFFKPGFLRGDGDGDGNDGKGVSANNGSGGQSGTADGDTIYIQDLTAEPGMTYSDLSLKYTEEQLQSAPSVTKFVSTEQEKYKCGDVEIIFDEWQLEDGIDELTVRELPELQDEASGLVLKAWDFSLLSGQHQFNTCVEVHIPRPEGIDDRTVSCVWFNEEAGAWEDKYYEISDDGKYYIIRTTHFSVGGFYQYVNSFFTGDKKEDTKKQDDTLFPAKFLYYPNGANSKNVMNTKVQMDVNSYMKYVEELSLNDPDGAAKYTFGGPVEDYNAKQNLLYYLDAAWFGFTNYKTASDGFNIAMDTAGYLDSIKGLSAFEKFSNMGTAISGLDITLTAWKVRDEVKNDKREFSTALKSAWAKHSGETLINLVSYGLSAALVGNPAGLAAVAGGTVLANMLYRDYSNSEAFKLDSLTDEEKVYQEFYKHTWGVTMGTTEINDDYYEKEEKKRNEAAEKGATTKKYKNALKKKADFPSLKRSEITIGPLSNLSDEQNELLRKQLLKQPLYSSGKGFGEAFSMLCDFSKGDKEYLDTLIDELYNEYANVFWKLSAEKHQEAAAYIFNELGIEGTFNEPDSYAEKSVYIENFVHELQSNTEKYLAKAEETAIAKTKDAHISLIKNTLVPMLNTKLVFKVTDKSLAAGETFDKSDYARNPLKKGNSDFKHLKTPDYSRLRTYMSFDGINTPKFTPGNAAVSLYYPATDSFLPQARENSDVVFECTLYHYLMMGAPDHMSFYETTSADEAKYKEKSISVKMIFPEKLTVGKKNTITIEIADKKADFTDILGIWEVKDYNGYDRVAHWFTQDEEGNLVWYSITSKETNYKVVDTYPIVEWDDKKKSLHIAPTIQWVGEKSERKTEDTVITLISKDEICIDSVGSCSAYRISEEEFAEYYDVMGLSSLSVPTKNDVSYDMSAAGKTQTGMQGIQVPAAGQVNLGGN